MCVCAFAFAPTYKWGKTMKKNTMYAINTATVTAALLFNIACAPTGDSVWKNSSYGSGTVQAANPAATIIKPNTGTAILN